jgi:hypothetical protein
VQVYGCAHCSHKEMYDETMRKHLKEKHNIVNPQFNFIEDEE